MKDKKKSKIIAAIAMISVFVMIAWRTIAGTYQHAWLAVFAGGIAMTIVSMFYKGESSNTKNNDNTDTDSN
ncbi:MAG: hypothetical protein J6I76_08530 [Oribacterium sp.]|nr:hypothetical protein [Oribacterium sp.]